MRESQGVFYQCKYLVAWCTKYRRQALCGDIPGRLKDILINASDEIHASLSDLKITPDSVSLKIDVCPQFGVNRAVRHLKGVSSHILRSEFPELKSRIPSLWTNHYFVATLSDNSHAPEELLKDFIIKQERTQKRSQKGQVKE